MLTSLDALEGATVIDLFAGSGALGIEALSRGAESVVFVDQDRLAIEAVRANLASLGHLATRAVVCRAEALAYAGTAPTADVVFADPPYAWDHWAQLLGHLAGRAGLLVAEAGIEGDPGPDWDTVKVKRYGSTVVTVMQPAMREKHRSEA